VGIFAPDRVVAVDWHGYGLWASVAANTARHPLPHRPGRHSMGVHAHRAGPHPPAGEEESFFSAASVPTLFLNMRVFSNDAAPGSADAAFYRRAEAAAVAGCGGAVALSSHDARALEALVRSERQEERRVSVLHPTLRSDLRELAATARVSAMWDTVGLGAPSEEDGALPRSRVLWCARWVPEKGAWRFVHLVRSLAGVLAELRLEPTMCHDAASEDPALPTRAQLAEAGISVLGAFQNASALAELYASSALFVHAATYDAFGMTALEAAAFGTPTLLHSAAPGGVPAVGVAERLRADKDECLQADWSAISNAAAPAASALPPVASCAHVDAASQALSHRVAALLCEASQKHFSSTLALIGMRARDRSMAWGPQHFAKALGAILQPLSAPAKAGDRDDL
jgi:hypothetical protein